MNLTSHEIAQKLESIPAGNRGISRRKPIYGVGVNDVNFITQTNVNGVAITHPGYMCWRGMLARCYSDKYQRKNKTYVGVSVCDDWLSLSKFLGWWKLNRVDGWHLDKDLLNPGNTVYSPENCIFVPPWLNSLVLDSKAIRGEFPIGVYYLKGKNKFTSQLKINGKIKFIGTFDTPDRAAESYKREKLNHVESLRDEICKIDWRLYPGVVYIISRQI
ncbi:hypothetical protein ACYUML_000687 [Aeromonas hydrophila]